MHGMHGLIYFARLPKTLTTAHLSSTPTKRNIWRSVKQQMPLSKGRTGAVQQISGCKMQHRGRQQDMITKLMCLGSDTLNLMTSCIFTLFPSIFYYFIIIFSA